MLGPHRGPRAWHAPNRPRPNWNRHRRSSWPPRMTADTESRTAFFPAGSPLVPRPRGNRSARRKSPTAASRIPPAPALSAPCPRYRSEFSPLPDTSTSGSCQPAARRAANQYTEYCKMRREYARNWSEDSYACEDTRIIRTLVTRWEFLDTFRCTLCERFWNFSLL